MGYHNHSGYYNCNSNGQTYTSNSTCGHQQSCNECPEIIKGVCVAYTGSNLTNTGVNTNDDLNAIMTKLDAIKAIQDTKNNNILAALNDINTRLNALESSSHAPYTLL